MDASTFPISFPFHLVFCIVAGLFFLMQFFRLRRPYQLLLAVAIPSSLLIYIGDPSNKTWFHTVGLFVLVLIVGAAVLAILARIQQRKAEKATADNTQTPTSNPSDNDAAV